MEKRIGLVTGASSGLGEQLAELLAKDGHDVVLVARQESKLEAVAERLAKSHGITAHVVPADLSRSEAPAAVFEACSAKRLAVDFLILNAGFGSNGAFLDLELDREIDMINVNVTSLVALTHLFARPMVERKRGRILHIASTAGFQPGPYMATYYATKSFVISFSEALAHELRGTGVSVTCHCPGATATEFAARAGNDKTRLFQRSGVASAADVATHAYRAMMRGQVLVVHGAANRIGVAGVRFTPRAWVRSMAAKFNQSSEP